MMNEDKSNRPGDNSDLDAQIQKELDEALGGMSLDDIVDAEETSRKTGTLQGRVIAIHGEDIFVDIGGRSEGILPANQYSEDEPLPKEGELIEVIIASSDEDAVRLRRPGAAQEVDWGDLQRGDVVEGRVSGHNKGGLELMVHGIRAFMPVSQIDVGRVEDMEPFVGQKLQAVVSDLDRNAKNLVLSRRQLVEQQNRERAEKLWESIHEGKIVQGTVRTIMPYGAFVDIGGVDGLLHISDMAYSRVEKPEDIVQPGQQVEVRVLKFDRETEKVSLGLKQTQADPWEAVEANYPVGETVTGRITKLMDFGAFMEVEAGIEGLIPISELSFTRIGHPREVVQEGDTVRASVIRVEPDRKRMALSLKQAGDDPWQGAAARWTEGSVVTGVVTRTADFGAFVKIADGVEGLIHISELDHKHISNVESVVSTGQTVSVKVLDVDEDRRRIGLSLKQASEPQAPQEGTMDDLQRVRESGDTPQKRKDLKGGLDGGSTDTPFGELRMG